MELTREVQMISQQVDIYEKKISEPELKVNQYEEKIAKMGQKADDYEERIGTVDKYISNLIPWTHGVSQSIAFHMRGSSLEVECRIFYNLLLVA